MSDNIRLFEGTGCGFLLMTENAPNLHLLFEVGKELVAYDNLDDLAGKIRCYLQQDKERKSIALAGQKACIEKHGYGKRIIEFENIIKKYSCEKA